MGVIRASKMFSLYGTIVKTCVCSVEIHRARSGVNILYRKFSSVALKSYDEKFYIWTR